MITDDEAKAFIAENVNRLLSQRKMSQSDLARETGENRMRISSIARGSHLPSASFLARLAEALGVGTDDLLRNPNAGKQRSKAS